MTHDIRPSVIAEEYLAELDRAAVALPAHQRAELLADVRSHIAVARAEAQSGNAAGAGDDEVVRMIISQLGDPQEIVAAALVDLPAAPSDARTAQTGSVAREAFALALLIIGGLLFWLIPVASWIGWLVGLVLLCVSRRWTLGDKLTGVAGVALAPLALTGSMFLTAGTESCTSDTAVAPAPGSQGNAQQPAMECTSSGTMSPVLVGCLVVALLALMIFATVRLARRTRQA